MSNGIIITGSFTQALRPGIDTWFGDEYKDYEPLYSKIFEVVTPDNRSYVEDAMVSGLGLMVVKDQAQGVRYDAAKQGISPRYDHVAYGLGFIITMEMLEDGLAMSKAERFTRQLKRSALKTRETIAHQTLNRAFTSGYTMTNGDGSVLCSTSHATRGGNQSNKLSVDADLSEAALEQAKIDIDATKDDRGLKVHPLVKSLIVSSSDQFNAHRILNSVGRVATADNDPNALKDMGVVKNLVVSPYLTDSDAWFLTTDVSRGLIFNNRKDPTMTSDNDFDTENAKFKCIMRFSCGWTDFRGVYGSQGA